MTKPTQATTWPDLKTCSLETRIRFMAHIAFPRNNLAKKGWEDPLPTPPIGEVCYEWAYQLATFLVPAALLALFWKNWCGALFWGVVPTFLFWGLPVSLRIGYLLDKHYRRLRARKLKRVKERDGYRYNAVGLIARWTGMSLQDITLPRVEQWAIEFDKEWAEHEKLEQQKREQEAAAAQARATRRYTAGTATAAAAGGAAYYASQGTDSTDNSGWDHPAVNPANGLPMTQGSMWDVAGNAYGTTDTTEDIWNTDGDSLWDEPSVNPASGLPMIPGGGPLDVAGNVYGTDGF